MTAAELILRKALVGSHLDSSQWNQVQAGLRNRAFFSSQVARANILSAARSLSSEYAEGHSDLSRLRMEMRQYLSQSGYRPDPKAAGTIKDLYSQARLDAIIKTNVAQARGFIQHAEGMTPGAFAAFPAQEFVRTHVRRVPRKEWPERWRRAGGKVYGGRMIALKTDPVWKRLGDMGPFGNPYPPFDWGSGMGVMDVGRDEAIALGLITAAQLRDRTAKIKSEKNLGAAGMNDDFSVPYNGNTAQYRRLHEMFQDQITHADGKIVWRSNLIRDAFASGEAFRIRLGGPTPDLKAMLPTDELRSMLRDKAFTLDGDWLDNPRKSGGTHRDHFEPREKDPRNIPLTQGDLDLIPTLWRHPDRVLSGVFRGSFICQLDTFDGGVLNMVVDVKRTPVIHTLYKNRFGMGLGASIEQRTASQRPRHIQHAEPRK